MLRPIAALLSILLVAGWFRKYRDERQRLMTPDDALALCRGGAALALG